MRLALQTVICCCVFTTVLPLLNGTAGELDTSLKKRFKVWLQSRVKRDLCSSLATADEQQDDVTVGPQQDDDAKGVSPPPSFGQHVRSRRSTLNKSSGCKFVTCVYHDLLHRLHQINELKSCAPGNKMGSKGYGRRRRSLLDAAQLALRTGRQRRSTEAGQRVRRHNSTRTVA
ncbi:pro-adrenomedullin isoform 1-T1 [Lycodopsis pacificus]